MRRFFFGRGGDIGKLADTSGVGQYLDDVPSKIKKYENIDIGMVDNKDTITFMNLSWLHRSQIRKHPILMNIDSC